MPFSVAGLATTLAELVRWSAPPGCIIPRKKGGRRGGMALIRVWGVQLHRGVGGGKRSPPGALRKRIVLLLMAERRLPTASRAARAEPGLEVVIRR